MGVPIQQTSVVVTAAIISCLIDCSEQSKTFSDRNQNLVCGRIESGCNVASKITTIRHLGDDITESLRLNNVPGIVLWKMTSEYLFFLCRFLKMIHSAIFFVIPLRHKINRLHQMVNL